MSQVHQIHTPVPLGRQLLARARTEGEAAAKCFTLQWGTGRHRQASGLLSPRNSGGALEFQDQRDYQLGDDLRHLNWRAFARTERLLMKQYSSEISPQVDVIFDVSRSMFLPEIKAAQVLALAWFFRTLGRTGGFRLQIWQSPAGGEPRLWDLDALENGSLAPSSEADRQALAPSLRLPLGRKSLRLLVSDLLFAASPDSVLGQGHDLPAGNSWVLVPFAREEAEPEWQGLMTLSCTESAMQDTRVWDRQAMRNLRNRYARHFAAWQSACAVRHIGFARISADEVLNTALLRAPSLGSLLRLTR